MDELDINYISKPVDEWTDDTAKIAIFISNHNDSDQHEARINYNYYNEETN